MDYITDPDDWEDNQEWDDYHNHNHEDDSES